MNLAEIRLALQRRSRRPGKIGALLASALFRLASTPTGDVEVRVWGTRLRLPADHHLPYIVGTNPLWSVPLVNCAAALNRSALTVVDVGANVGDSVVLLESHLPGMCRFVCVEPNSEWVPYLTANTAGLPVEIIQSFIGEGQHLEIKEGEPGTAGSQIAASGQRSIPLDEICSGRKVDLIKVDTDGFDFPILRSGRHTLSTTRPALFFEWDPPMWRRQGENPASVFDWLAEAGYEDVCLFADSGFFACRMGTKAADMTQSLIAIAESRQGIDNVYWDVFAASAEACDRAVQNNLKAIRKLTETVHHWNRLQPTYWV
jgi:FkbM family methyltransferase